MDKFKPGEDVFCTQDGKAQDRIPNDLSQEAYQEGTVINAKMVNSWTEEIVNAIKKLGITPDRNQENQFSIGINKKTVYNQVGEVNSWLCSKEYIPKTEAVLDGTLLKPEDFEDGLATLKQRCPSWISGDNIQLPNYNKHFPRFEPSRLGGYQGDAMQKVTLDVEYSLETPESQSISYEGDVDHYAYDAKGDYRDNHRIIDNLTGVGGLGYQATIIQKYETTYSFGTPQLTFTHKLEQDGAIANENRPKNFAVLMSVVVGIPKKLVVASG